LSSFWIQLISPATGVWVCRHAEAYSAASKVTANTPAKEQPRQRGYGRNSTESAKTSKMPVY
jgi:hypothetical protein